MVRIVILFLVAENSGRLCNYVCGAKWGYFQSHIQSNRKCHKTWKQANVKRKEATEETPGKSYKLNQLCNKISILSESSFIIETKSNLEKATASLPAETKTYPNTKEDKGLD